MAVIADKCPPARATVVDINEARIAAWKSDTLAGTDSRIGPRFRKDS
jgi:hypothetical protein